MNTRIPRRTLARASLAALFGTGLLTAVPAQSTERVSVPTVGTDGSGLAVASRISADGRFVAFASDSQYLAPDDTEGWVDCFVRDRQQGTTELVSLSTGGGRGNQASGDTGLAISGDGRFVAFGSFATNLVPGDTNGVADVFVRDRLNHTTERISVSTAGVQADGPSADFGEILAISADGRFVAFSSLATNLVAGDTNAQRDVFVRDRQAGSTTRVSLSTDGGQGNLKSYAPAISADGRYVAFESLAANLVAGDVNNVADIFVRDRQLVTTTRVSLSTAGAQGNAASGMPAISADGRFITFQSSATNLIAGDTNETVDVFLRDRAAQTTERVSKSTAGAQGDGPSWSSSISADGRFVAFDSFATNLVPGDSNRAWDIFVRDRLSNTTERTSLSAQGDEADSESFGPCISSDGRAISFQSFASNLVAGDINGTWDAFARDRGPSAPYAFCSGDAAGAACPCANSGSIGHGCNNSANTGGAVLSASGSASLTADSLVLTASDELPNALTSVVQGIQLTAPTVFGDGVRCVGGALKRLYSKTADNGTVSVPETGDLSISARSAAAGDPIPLGATRYYFTYYRDPSPSFCADPAGNAWNATNALAVVWGP